MNDRTECGMKIILCGGGTAGHVNPALAIAEEIRRREPSSKILCISALWLLAKEIRIKIFL